MSVPGPETDGQDPRASAPPVALLQPALVMGTFTEFKDQDKLYAALRHAIRLGYRLIDTASMYETEEVVGSAVRDAVGAGEVRRQDLFIMSKLWNSEHHDVRAACQQSLERLKLDYVDCYLIHWPTKWTPDSVRLPSPDGGPCRFSYTTVHQRDPDQLIAVWRDMEQLVAGGKARHLGVSNFDPPMLNMLASRGLRVMPLLNQIEVHVLLQQPKAIAAQERLGVRTIAYSPFGGLGHREAGDPNLLENPVLLGIAARLGCSPAQVALKFLLQQRISVVAKSLTRQHIEENWTAASGQWQVDSLSMLRLQHEDKGFRFTRPPWFDFGPAVGTPPPPPAAVAPLRRPASAASLQLKAPSISTFCQSFCQSCGCGGGTAESADWNSDRGGDAGDGEEAPARRLESQVTLLSRVLQVTATNVIDILEDAAKGLLGGSVHPQALRSLSLPVPIAQQPSRREGTYLPDSGFYKNTFCRPGKVLSSDIYIKRGSIADFAATADTIMPRAARLGAVFVVTDAVVVGHGYPRQVAEGLCARGYQSKTIVLPAQLEDGVSSAEPSKNLHQLSHAMDQVLKHGINKHSTIVSVGGGVVNNICGVLAALLYRGISLVHVTTTTMGMFDAAIDFKQAVNHERGKNLVGCYYPASAILIDPDCVASLERRHAANGLAEAIKHGFAQSWELQSFMVRELELRGPELICDGQYLEEVCRQCIECKIPTLDNYHSSNFNEMCPQYGHAIGHAIEYLSWEAHEGHTPLLHGEAVAIGMCVSAEVSYLLGLCDRACVEEHYSACAALQLPCLLPTSMRPADVLGMMRADKHFVGVPAMGLCSKVGSLAPAPTGAAGEDAVEARYDHAVDPDTVLAALVANVARREAP